jgi:tripartite-type tricarboxylate transporter receptor subunit TctC
MTKKSIGFIVALCVSMSGWASELIVPKELQGKIITVIVPYNPGGDTDATQRFMVDRVKEITKLNMVVVNKAGAGGIIGAREVAENSAPTGLTLLASDNATFVVNSALEYPYFVDKKLLAPVSVFAVTPQFFYVGINSGINTIDDLINRAKNDPKFTVACNVLHQCLYTSIFFNHYGITPYTVNFRTPAEMGIAAFNGDITVFGAGATSGKPLVDAGKTRALAVGWNKKLSVYPDAVPLSTKIPTFKANNLQMISVPIGTPKHIVEFWNNAYRVAAKTKLAQQRFDSLSIIHTDYDISATTKLLDEEYNEARKYRHLVKSK